MTDVSRLEQVGIHLSSAGAVCVDAIGVSPDFVSEFLYERRRDVPSPGNFGVIPVRVEIVLEVNAGARPDLEGHGLGRAWWAGRN